MMILKQQKLSYFNYSITLNISVDLIDHERALAWIGKFCRKQD
jgi:hypothetical protein